MLLLHANPSLAFTTGGHYEGQSGLAACNAPQTRIDGGATSIWYALAAFPPDTDVHLRGVTFGIDYDDSAVAIEAFGKSCDFELFTNNWPAPESGVGLTWNATQTAHVVELYWFAGENYLGTVAEFELRPHPIQGGSFADDSTPARITAISDYGVLGFDSDGYAPDPCTATESATVTARVFLDQNEDCTYSPDPGAPRAQVLLLPEERVRTVGPDGTTKFRGVEPGPHTLTVLTQSGYLDPCAQDTFERQLSVSIPGDSVDFPLRRSPDYRDLCGFLPAGVARPGFDDVLHPGVLNLGGSPEDVTIVLHLPSEVDFVGADVPGTWDEEARTFTAVVASLMPGSSRVLSIEEYVHQGLLPHTWIGPYTMEVQPVVGDAIPENNTCLMAQEVRTSWDPNDMLVSPEGEVEAGAELHYRVNFQNTGNAEAFTVVVRDTLRPELDIANLRFGATSHAATWLVEDREIIWSFANINLPDSSSNEPRSHGFVEYSIRTKASLTPSTPVVNRAGIYFDFNPVVLTNATMNLIHDPTTGVQQTDPARPFRFVSSWPNPMRDQTSLHFLTPTAGRLRSSIFDASGRLIRSLDSRLTDGGDAAQTWDGLNSAGAPAANGVYFIRSNFEGETGKVVAAPTRLIVVR